jgi:hypothetical protein
MSSATAEESIRNKCIAKYRAFMKSQDIEDLQECKNLFLKNILDNKSKLDTDNCLLLSVKRTDKYNKNYDPSNIIKNCRAIYDLHKLRNIFDILRKDNNRCNAISVVLYIIDNNVNKLIMYLLNIITSANNISRIIPDWVFRIYLDVSVFETLHLIKSTHGKNEHYWIIFNSLNFIFHNPNCEIYINMCNSNIIPDPSPFNMANYRLQRYHSFMDDDVNIAASREADGVISLSDCYNLHVLSNPENTAILYSNGIVNIDTLENPTLINDNNDIKFHPSYTGEKNSWGIFYGSISNFLNNPDFFNNLSQNLISNFTLDETLNSLPDNQKLAHILNSLVSQHINPFVSKTFNRKNKYLFVPQEAGLIAFALKIKKTFWNTLSTRTYQFIHLYNTIKSSSIPLVRNIDDSILIGSDEIILLNLYEYIAYFNYQTLVDGSFIIKNFSKIITSLYNNSININHNFPNDVAISINNSSFNIINSFNNTIINPISPHITLLYNHLKSFILSSDSLKNITPEPLIILLIIAENYNLLSIQDFIHLVNSSLFDSASSASASASASSATSSAPFGFGSASATPSASPAPFGFGYASASPSDFGSASASSSASALAPAPFGFDSASAAPSDFGSASASASAAPSGFGFGFGTHPSVGFSLNKYLQKGGDISEIITSKTNIYRLNVHKNDVNNSKFIRYVGDAGLLYYANIMNLYSLLIPDINKNNLNIISYVYNFDLINNIYQPPSPDFNDDELYYRNKYLKYKNKYLSLKSQMK